MDAELKPLVEGAPDAPFGHGSKTVYDKNVRDAKQYKFSDGGFTVENFDPASIHNLEKIKTSALATLYQSYLIEELNTNGKT